MQEDREDLELLRGALEALLACFAVPEQPGLPPAGGGDEVSGVPESGGWGQAGAARRVRLVDLHVLPMPPLRGSLPWQHGCRPSSRASCPPPAPS